MATAKYHYDAHCHLFNLNYLFLEIFNMLVDWRLGQYGCRTDKGIAEGGIREHFANLTGWLRGINTAINRSEAEHLTELQKGLEGSWNNDKPARIVPLMMDIYFMFDQPLYAGQSVGEGEKTLYYYDKTEKVSAALTEAEKILKEADCNETIITEAHTEFSEWVKKADKDHEVHYRDTLGFRKHRTALEELQKMPGPRKIYPFFAVDPRRHGVIQAVLDGEVVGPGKPFHGVKLYPRLGYHPCCKDLEPLFKWCDDNRVPIITHCGPGGFSQLNNDYSDFGAPCSFRTILENHKTLIIDFAHFGTAKTCWAEEIIRFMGQYEHVYSDLACYSRRKEVTDFKKNYWNKGNVADRTLFGTDYSMIYFDAFAGLEQYYQNFRDLRNPGAFTSAEREHMDEVAEQFLHV